MPMTPEEILVIHKGYADEFSALATSGLSAAYGALSSSGLFDYQPAAISIASPRFGQPTDFTNRLPTLPANPEFTDAPDLFGFVDAPGADYGAAPVERFGVPPVFAPIDQPTGGAPTFDLEAPEMPDVGEMPESPSYLSLPDYIPLSISIPTAPAFTEPTFDGIRPDQINAVDPNTIISAYMLEQQNHRSLMTSFVADNADTFIARYAPEYATIRARINDAIVAYTDPTTGGGAGIPSQIEDAIQARMERRTNDEFQSALESTADTLGKQGWTIPGGALLASMRAARLKMGDAVVAGAIDVATKNVELEQKQFQFMYEKGTEIETKMLAAITDWLRLALQIDAQAIESAKQIVAAYLGAYNIQVMVYKAQWDGYVAAAQVLTAKVGVLEARARVYAERVAAEVAKSNVNRAQAEVMKAYAEINQSMAMAYKAEIDAVLAPLELQRLRIAGYEAQARAFASEVQAWESQYRAYVASVEGETAQQKAFETRVGIYREEVNAWKAKIDAYATRVNATTQINQARTSYNDGQIRIWTGQTDQAIKRYEGLLAGYKAGSDVIVEQAKIDIEHWKAQSSLIMQQWSITVQQTFEYAREQMNLFRGQMEAAISAGNGLANAANVSGHLAGSAMSGLTSFAGRLYTA